MTDIVERLRLVHEHDSRGIFKDAADEIERLRAALATVLGTATHGQHMTWEERIKIGRAALAATPAPSRETDWGPNVAKEDTP